MIEAFRNMGISLNIDGSEDQGMKIQGQERLWIVIDLCEYHGERNKITVFLIIIKSTQQVWKYVY